MALIEVEKADDIYTYTAVNNTTMYGIFNSECNTTFNMLEAGKAILTSSKLWIQTEINEGGSLVGKDLLMDTLKNYTK